MRYCSSYLIEVHQKYKYRFWTRQSLLCVLLHALEITDSLKYKITLTNKLSRVKLSLMGSHIMLIIIMFQISFLCLTNF